MQTEITIDKNAVSRAVRGPLEAYYKEVAVNGYDGSAERPGNWEANEDICKAIGKSKYVYRHLDWLYVIELIYAVLDNNPPLKASDFAAELEKLIVATADHRDYLAIFPLSFKPTIGFFLTRNRKPIVKKKEIGEFIVSPATPSHKTLNKIIDKYGFPHIDESSFLHAMRTSNAAFSRDMVITFKIHGAEEQ